MAWTVEVDGAALDELEKLPKDMRARFVRIVELLESFGPRHVGMPHVRHLEGPLWEMRLRGRDGIARAIYFSAKGQRLVVVRAFVKKTQKTPRREIELAYRRMKGADDA